MKIWSLVFSDHFLAPNERWALPGEKAPFSTYPSVHCTGQLIDWADWFNPRLYGKHWMYLTVKSASYLLFIKSSKIDPILHAWRHRTVTFSTIQGIITVLYVNNKWIDAYLHQWVITSDNLYYHKILWTCFNFPVMVFRVKHKYYTFVSFSPITKISNFCIFHCLCRQFWILLVVFRKILLELWHNATCNSGSLGTVYLKWETDRIVNINKYMYFERVYYGMKSRWQERNQERQEKYG